MSERCIRLSVLTCCLVVTPAYAGGGAWVNFNNETGTRISAPAGITTSDPREKDYAWGDVDGDGDTDLVIVRKQPFTSTGKDTNVLLLNQNGVLTDATSLVTASDVGGDNGFETPTNDRDVILVDVDNDGWLDMVTATTLTDNHLRWSKRPVRCSNLNASPEGFRHYRRQRQRTEPRPAHGWWR